MVPPSGVVIDVGSDHGLLAVALLKEGKAKSVINIEKSPGPLQAGVSTAARSPFSAAITHLLSDGFAAYRGPSAVDTVVLAGFGGRTIARVVADAPVAWKTLVVQPANNAAFIRRFARQRGYCVQDERIIADHRFYELIRLGHEGTKIKTEQDVLFGPINLQRREASFLTYWKERLDYLLAVRARAQAKTLDGEIAMIQTMLGTAGQGEAALPKHRAAEAG